MCSNLESISCVVVHRDNPLSIVSRCINSIRQSQLADCEIILVDDCSTETVPESIRSLCNVYIKNRSHRGIAFSRNRGIKLAKSNLVFVVDSDIELTKFNLGAIFTLFKDEERLVAVSGRYNSVHLDDWNKVLDLRREKIYLKSSQGFIYSSSYGYTSFSGGFSVISKERVKGVRLHSLRDVSGQDIYFQLSLLSKGHRFAYSPALEGVHHHPRNLEGGIKKALREAKGGAWAVYKSIAKGLHVPALDGMNMFPILIFIGILTQSFIPLFLELIPYFVLVLVGRGAVHVKLALYYIVLCVARIPYSFIYLFSKELGIKGRFRYIAFLLHSSITAKARWIDGIISHR